MLEEFKKFAMRGNVVDLAVAVIIGAAFGAIVNSLVGDIIMPIIGSITGGLDFSNYFLPLSSKVTASSLVEARKQGAVLAWGNFFTLVINFLIIAWVLFGVLLIGRVRYGWRGRSAVRWTLSGFGVLVLAYFGSKFVLEYILGRHWG